EKHQLPLTPVSFLGGDLEVVFFVFLSSVSLSLFWFFCVVFLGVFPLSPPPRHIFLAILLGAVVGHDVPLPFRLRPSPCAQHPHRPRLLARPPPRFRLCRAARLQHVLAVDAGDDPFT